MDKEKEISKIRQVLKIPVNDVNFNSDYVEITSGTQSIGGIPYYTVSGIISYDYSADVVNWLKWSEVYQQYKDEINKHILDLIGNEEISITVGTFRKLYVKNKMGEIICTINCIFEDGWIVKKLD